MRLKEKGRFYELPIIGLHIDKIIYDGFITLVFNDDEESTLKLDGELEILSYGQKAKIQSYEKEAVILFCDLRGENIKEAKADKLGRLYLIFDKGLELTIDEGPYESWHYIKLPKMGRDSLHVHGGSGLSF